MSQPYPIVIQSNGEDFYDYEALLEGDTAVGAESKVLSARLVSSADHFLKPISRRWSSPTARFYELTQEWEESTAALSSITTIAMHPAYQKIIGMGEIALPLIMRELRTRPNHWFWALKAITGEDPVPSQHRGHVRKMAVAWLDWWKENKYNK